MRKSSLTLISWTVTRSAFPSRRTLPSSGVLTFSRGPISRASKFLLLSAYTDVREATCRLSIDANALISSSVMLSFAKTPPQDWMMGQRRRSARHFERQEHPRPGRASALPDARLMHFFVLVMLAMLVLLVLLATKSLSYRTYWVGQRLAKARVEGSNPFPAQLSARIA